MYNIEKYNNIFEKYFNNYISNADSETKHLHLTRKKDHSYRVRELALKIAKDLNLKDEEIFIVNLIALFHDIGRFKQFDKYGTYVDSLSENHALISIEVLKSENILSDLSNDHVNIILKAIEYHNLMKLPENINEKLYLYASILRDADKIDYIYSMINIIPKLPRDEQAIFYSSKKEENYISDETYNNIIGKKNIHKDNITTVVEIQAATLGFITSDMKFRKSIEIINKSKYVDMVYNMMDKSHKLDGIYLFVKSYMNEKLNVQKKEG